MRMDLVEIVVLVFDGVNPADSVTGRSLLVTVNTT